MFSIFPSCVLGPFSHILEISFQMLFIFIIVIRVTFSIIQSHSSFMSSLPQSHRLLCVWSVSNNGLAVELQRRVKAGLTGIRGLDEHLGSVLG